MVGSVIIGVILLFFVNKKSHLNPYIVVLSCADSAAEQAATELLRSHVPKCVVKSKTAAKGSVELNLEIRLKEGSDLQAVKAEMQQIAGNKYKVLDRFEQQEDTFKIMSIEKMIAYIFLTFILVVACFNIIGSLSMLIIDKKNDVVTLRNLGANDKQITRVFLFEGRMIAVIGAVIGIGLGLLLCFLQQQYGFVRLGDSEGSFIVDAYPVSVHYSDVAIIFVTVIAVGWLAVWYPVRALSKRLLS